MSPATGSSTKMGYAQYVCLPDDGRRHEIIDGEHYVNPAPSTDHQTVSKRLQFQLYSQIELRGLGLFFSAPIDVQLSDHDIVQPDLVIVMNARRGIVTPAMIKGAPDLIVEIVSPSSAESDRTRKRLLYQYSDVSEYWIVDPFDRSLQQLVLRDGEYRPQPAAEEIRPTIADGFVIRLSEVW